MKKFVNFMILLFFIQLFSYELRNEQNQKDFEVPFIPFSKKLIFDYEKNVLVVHQKDIKPEGLNFILLSLGYQYSNIVNEDNSFSTVKHLIDSIENIKKLCCIILIGDENRINPYRNCLNPYTSKYFSSDLLFSNPFYDTLFVPVSRIPVSNQEQLNIYIEKLKNFLFDNSTVDFIFSSPFYDYNSDSTEDYLYFTYPYFINKVLKGKIYGETNSSFPKYTYTYEKLPDSLMFPQYNWIFELNMLNQETDNFIFTYRGHGNTISTVLPDFSLSDIYSLNFSKSGIFLFFSCLVGSFDKTNSNYERSFSESLLVSDCNSILTFSSSSETFYQYNNYMMNKFFDFFNDNCFKLEKTENESIFLDLYTKLVFSFLNYAGINDYSISQILSYNIFGVPILNMKKSSTNKPYLISNYYKISDSLIEVNILQPCKINIFSKEKILDTFYFSEPTKFCYRFFNLKPESFYYISSYKNGVLFIDSFYLDRDSIYIDTIFFSDSLSNNNDMIEEGEPIQIYFKLNCNIDQQRISIISNSCEIIENIIFDKEFYKVIVKPLKGIKSLDLNIMIDSFNFYFSFPVNMFRIVIDSIISNETVIFYENQEYQLGILISKVNDFPSESIQIKFLNKGYKVLKDTFWIKTPFEEVIIWNYFTFFNDTNQITIEYSNGFINDTISIKILTSKRFSMFFFDPLNNYQNSNFLTFLKDSMKIFVNISNRIDTSIFYSSYFFSYGVYPKIYHITSTESKFIEKLASYNIPLIVEGGDVFGYDKEGKRIKELFNINESYDGNYLYKGSNLKILPLNLDVLYDTTNNYMDYYITDQPVLTYENKIFGSLKDNRIAQSPLLKNLKYLDENILYYHYTLFLFDFHEGISFKETIDISIDKNFEICSNVDNPQLIFCTYLSSFIDSIKFENGRVIDPYSKKTIKIFIKRNSPPFFTKIVLSTGFSEYTLFLKYTPYTQTKKVKEKEILKSEDKKIYFDRIGRKVFKNDLKTFDIYFTEDKKILILKK
ncbi:MAG: C25 family cysteine peptidase [candidate division WOR-3 bacterium]